ncbi:hypothetical protein ACOZ4N_00590 (plasmid) [Halorientalis pallida]|uniref:hypothetical protein n=1 Tax=Halorientalis pallida TaxID=2479928 RepID=UPI003C6F6D88
MSATAPSRSWHGVQITQQGGLSVAIVGSRSFPFEQAPVRCVEAVGQALLDTGWPVAEIVSGGADGVDAAAAALADVGSVPITVLEPNWDTYGEAAGPRRNTKIVQRADAVLAFWNGTSPGTRDTLAKARAVLDDDQIAICGIGDADPDLQLIDPVDPNQ